MKKRINKSSRCFFLLALAVTSIVVTALPGFFAKVQADNLSVASSNISIPSNSSVPLNLPVAVIISREIKPFIEMVEGFESALDQPVVRIFIDQDSKPFSHDPLYKGPQIEHYSFVIAVGPSALSYLVKNNNLVDDKRSTSFDTNLLTANARVKSNGIALTAVRKILYAMVLNPETIIPEGVSLCGVSLNIFSEDTVLKITKVFPSVRKMGVLFDPANNSEWFAAAIKNGVFSGITTVPMHIMEESDVNRLNQQDVSNVDALLFIPDKTVTSPTIISHIIKQSIARKIPVIGYNSFFHKSGAALSFILDYRKIGGQMAYKVLALSQGEFSESKGALAHGKSCEPSTPAYYMTLNRSVVELLDIELGSTLPSELKVEP